MQGKYDFTHYNPANLTFATEEPVSLLIRSASFGAARNEYGSDQVRFPLRMLRLGGSGRPQLRKAEDATYLLLPADWGIVVYAQRDLHLASVESDGEVVKLDGTNFAVLLGKVGTEVVVRGRWWRKQGKWSRTVLIDDRFHFTNELHSEHPHDDITDSDRFMYAMPLLCPPRDASEVVEL